MKISIRNINDAYIIDIHSKKMDDFLARLLKKTLNDLIKNNKINIYINFSLIESINPNTLGVILAAHRACENNGGKINIFGIKPDMLLIFHIIQLDKYIRLYNSEYDAFENINVLTKRKLRIVK